MKEHYCIDCGKQVSVKTAKRCFKCCKQGKNNPSYRHGRYINNKKCMDCNKKITNNAKRCGSCAMKYKIKIGKHPTYKHGKWNNTFCIDCGKKLKNYSSQRCPKCFGKWERGDHNPNWKNGKTYRFCKYCGIRIKNTYANMCGLCKNQKIKTSKNTIVKHHLYLKENSPIILKLTSSKHHKLHSRVYDYLYDRYGEKGVDNYIKWFDKKFGLKIK